MLVSLIIPTYNREEILCKTINSLIKQAEMSDYEIEVCIVDQTKIHNEETEKFLKETIETREYIKIIKEDKPSLPNARNIGVRKTTGDIIVFIDDDVELEDGFIEEHVKCYEDELVDSVVGRVTICNGSKDNVLLNHTNSYLKRTLKQMLLRKFKNKAATITKNGVVIADFSKEESLETDSVIGCNMSFRRSIITEHNGFDVNYIGNAIREESDLCVRIIKDGGRISFNPKAHLYHIMANKGGCRAEKDEEYWTKFYHNQVYFLVKNFNLSRTRIKINLIFDIINCAKNDKINALKIINKQYKLINTYLKEKINDFDNNTML
jgi:GT2 family glycosyltransferase